VIALKEYYGCWSREPDGRIYPKNIPIKQPAIAISNTGPGGGIFLGAWQRILEQMDENSQINLTETFADGTFASAKKRVIRSAPPAVAKELKL
tara:strand:+ start:952 stop:1230 length:279 start_codon:yes stop_codon:yes gene_type:complete